MPNERFPLRVSNCLCFAFALSALGSRANAATACIWRVTNVPVPFYLVGTIHALSGTDYPLPKPYDQALRDSNRLLFELDPSPKSDFPEKFVRAAIYPKGDDIRSHIHSKTWDFLAKNFKISNYFGKTFKFSFGNIQRLELGHYQVEGIQQLRPWAIAYMVWAIRGYNDVFSIHGVDNHLAYQARRLGKETGSLETADEHVDVLRGMSDIDSEIVLLDAMVRGDKRRDDYNEARAAWKHSDLGPIVSQEKRFRDLNLGASLRLLDYRNLRWIRKIEAEMKTGKPTSIVAGTGHFCGPNNVIELLQKKGYKIEQL